MNPNQAETTIYSTISVNYMKRFHAKDRVENRLRRKKPTKLFPATAEQRVTSGIV